MCEHPTWLERVRTRCKCGASVVWTRCGVGEAREMRVMLVWCNCYARITWQAHYTLSVQQTQRYTTLHNATFCVFSPGTNDSNEKNLWILKRSRAKPLKWPKTWTTYEIWEMLRNTHATLTKRALTRQLTQTHANAVLEQNAATLQHTHTTDNFRHDK